MRTCVNESSARESPGRPYSCRMPPKAKSRVQKGNRNAAQRGEDEEQAQEPTSDAHPAEDVAASSIADPSLWTHANNVVEP